MPRDRHTKEYYRKREPKVPNPIQFVAVDGEGTEEGGRQVYSLLSSSLHNPLTRKIGLGTEECLLYLLNLKTDDRTQLVSFFFSYDINMILKDVPWPEIICLYEENECRFEGRINDYRIRIIPGHQVTITEYTKQRVFHLSSERVRSVSVWDTWGFFQGSFLRAVREWKIELTPEQQTILEEGKEERGGFLWSDLEKLTRYNHLECDLLVRLMDKVQEMLRGMDLFLSRWDGAGAVASALMKKHNLKAHVKQGYGEEIEEALLRAYFGGRSQCVQFGHFPGPIYHYDINSAYPSSYLNLPTLHGTWEEVKEYRPSTEYGMYQLEWDVPRNEPVIPFPYRLKDGSISYPEQGRGIYHAQLVNTAMKKWGRHIHVERGWIFHPETDEKPFAFILPFMSERMRLKREGDLRHITMKLAANSIYGKTAQALCFGGDVPPYQSYLWAGMITSWTHCRLLEAAMQAPKHIIFFGTDSIFSSKPLKLPLGISLGSWEECETLTRFELYQPGIYRMCWEEEGGEKQECKVRGFPAREVDFEQLAEEWQRNKYGGMVKVKTTRFRGYNLSVHQGNRKEWAIWKVEDRTLHLRPGGYGISRDIDKKAFHDRGCLRAAYRFDYITGGKTLSAKFKKKGKQEMNDSLVSYLDNPGETV